MKGDTPSFFSHARNSFPPPFFLSYVGNMKISELSPNDLKVLREVVFRVRMQHYPVESFTTVEADRIIESIGEETAQRMIKRLVDMRQQGRA